MEKNKLRKGHRSRLEIVRDILLLLKDADNPGYRKTHIMYGANLSYKLLKRYMEDVSEAGLIKYIGESYYTITEKGKTYLQLFKDYEERFKDLRKCLISLNNGKEELEKLLES